MICDEVYKELKDNGHKENKLQFYKIMYKVITEKTNTVGFSVGNNDRYRIRNRFCGVNLSVLICYLRNNNIADIKLNKNGNLNLFIKTGFVIHHIDRNKMNDLPENLIVIKDSGHRKADYLGTQFSLGLITEKEYTDYLKSISF